MGRLTKGKRKKQRGIKSQRSRKTRQAKGAGVWDVATLVNSARHLVDRPTFWGLRRLKEDSKIALARPEDVERLRQAKKNRRARRLSWLFPRKGGNKTRKRNTHSMQLAK